jgi:hypothetical protein
MSFSTFNFIRQIFRFNEPRKEIRMNFRRHHFL